MSERVIILGTGSIGMQYAQALKKMGCLPILISIRSDRWKELESAGYSVAKELNANVAESADCCIIATETNRHVEDATYAMKLGLRVLVEKPLGVSAEDIVKFERLKTKLNLSSLRVVCPMRWNAAVVTVRENLEKIGRVHSVNICCQSYLPDWRPERDYRTSYSASPNQGGVLRDLVHEIDYCNYLFGLPSAGDVQFTGIRGASIGIDSTSNAMLSWRMTEQTLVSIQLDYLTRSARRSICVYGENGEIRADLISGEVKCVLAGSEVAIQNSVASQGSAMESMLESFLGNDGAGCTFQQALEAARIVDACEERMRDLS